MIHVRATSIIVLGSLVACGASPNAAIKSPKPGSTNTTAWNRMHAIAAEDLTCPIGELTTKQLSNNERASHRGQSFAISGCGKTEMLLIEEPKGPRSKYSTPWTIYSDKQLRSTLQFALAEKCPEWSVEFMDDTTRGVTACGEKFVYVLGLNGWSSNATQTQ